MKEIGTETAPSDTTGIWSKSPNKIRVNRFVSRNVAGQNENNEAIIQHRDASSENFLTDV